jgi:hypothetical protein
MLDVPSLGSDALTLSVSLDKAWAATLVESVGVPTPPRVSMRSAREAEVGAVVARPKWTVKRVCQSCAAKCYGLGRSLIACPQCGTRFNPEAPLKSCRSRPVFVG